jgi:hypothetical protein
MIINKRSKNTNLLVFCSYILFMDNGLVTSNGTKFFAVAGYGSVAKNLRIGM